MQIFLFNICPAHQAAGHYGFKKFRIQNVWIHSPLGAWRHTHSFWEMSSKSTPAQNILKWKLYSAFLKGFQTQWLFPHSLVWNLWTKITSWNSVGSGCQQTNSLVRNLEPRHRTLVMRTVSNCFTSWFFGCTFQRRNPFSGALNDQRPLDWVRAPQPATQWAPPIQGMLEHPASQGIHAENDTVDSAEIPNNKQPPGMYNFF